MRLVPMSIKAADEFVAAHHRHHKPTGGKAKFALGAENDGRLVGVVICGRPKARGLDDGVRLEVVRLCTHGDSANAVSFLLSRARRAAAALGYTQPLITYIQAGESGASLKASGWCKTGEVAARSWDTPSRRRIDDHAIVRRERWQAPGG